MKPHLFLPAIFTLILLGCLSTVSAQEMVEESSTGKKFPKTATFTFDGKEYSLDITGATVRKKFFFKVYGVAHYLENAEGMSNQDAFEAALTDGKAKQIVMNFSRNVDAGKIQGAYREAIEKNTNKEEFRLIQPLVEQFVGYFDKDVKENEQYILRWLPGSVIVSIVQGEEKPAISNKIFARALWATWLGNHSIVKRHKLIDF